jgi:hypothetical protein
MSNVEEQSAGENTQLPYTMPMLEYAVVIGFNWLTRVPQKVVGRFHAKIWNTNTNKNSEIPQKFQTPLEILQEILSGNWQYC